MNALSEHESQTTELDRDDAAERRRRNLLHARAKRLSRRDRSGVLSRTRR